MSELSGRKLAQKVLDLVESEAAYANLALKKVLGSHSQLERREKAFCTELVYGTLRNLLKIDFYLGRLLSRPLKTLPVPILNLLRISLYQLLFLTDLPERAVCHEAVEMVKSSRFRGLAGLVNGVLRSFLRQRNELTLPGRDQDLIRYLSLEYSHPAWLVARWVARFGPERTEEILVIDNEQPALTVRINRLRAKPTEIQAYLDTEGIKYTPGLFLKEALTFESLPRPIEELSPFSVGQIFPQDESSMLVAHLVAPQPGEQILDLCAAPGGKSTHLAELLDDRGLLVSMDDHPHKIALLGENASRLGLRCIQPVLGDARSWQPASGTQYDAVLVDAPCSGSGVLRRRVDARYRHREQDILKLQELQRAILNHAADLVLPGGRLVYSTCTLEREENQEQIKSFCENHPEFRINDWRRFLPPGLEAYLEDPQSQWAQILPIARAGDGFFMCRLEKTGE